MAATAVSHTSDPDRPWLLYHPKNGDDQDSTNAVTTLNFFSFADPRRIVYSVDLPSPTSSFLGSGHGWLILYDSSSHSLSLFNPLTKNQLLLPSLLTLPHLRRSESSSDKITVRCMCYSNEKSASSNSKSLPSDLIFRSILIPDPTNSPSQTLSGDGLTVFLVLLRPPTNIAFAMPGDRKWRKTLDEVCMDAVCHVGSIEHSDTVIRVFDMDECKLVEERVGSDEVERLVTVKTDSTIIAWKYRDFLASPGVRAIYITREFDDWMELHVQPMGVFLNSREITFFVVSSPNGQVWSVRKELKGSSVAVKVYGMEMVPKEVVSLDGYAIFVGGGNTSFCVSPREYPGVRGDCVYFAEQCRVGRQMPIGVYSLKDKRMEPILPGVVMEVYPQPAWFLPSVLARGEEGGPSTRN